MSQAIRARRSRARWAGLALGALLLGLPGAARGAGPDAVVTELAAAREGGRVGRVDVVAVADAPRPAEPPRPVQGVEVALLPWHPDVEAALEAVKAHSRDSAERFLASAAEVRTVLTGWYAKLGEAGGRELVSYATTDSSGAVRFEPVPAGDWLLIAFRTAPTRAEPSARASRRDGGGFAASPETTGYNLISYWRARVAVTAGSTAGVRLTDRGVWLAAVEPILKPGAEPPVGTGTRRHR